MHDDNYILADAATLTYVTISLIATGLSMLGYLLTRPKNRGNFQFDNTPTNLAQRGSYAPLVIGHERVGYVFAWAGDRITKKIKHGGGKNFGGGGSTEYVYYESGLHVIAVGAVDGLYRIRANEKIIWEGPILRSPDPPLTGTPSGTTFECDDGEGSFTIYWGNCNQPVNEYLADPSRLGVRSRWPHFCYILWNRKKLGGSPQWPQMDYEIFVRTNNFNVSFPGGPSTFIEQTDSTVQDRGPNPHIWLWQLLTGDFPHGLGMMSSMFDDSVADLGTQMVAEHLPVSMSVRDGQDASDAIATMLQEWGCALVQDGDKLKINMIRAIPNPATLPIVRADIQSGPLPETIKQQGDFEPDRLIYFIRDKTNGYNSWDINIPDDSQAIYHRRPQPQRVEILTVRDRKSGYVIAKRRETEYMSKGQSIKFVSSRGARLLRPGDAFIMEGIGQLRLMTSKPQFDSMDVELESVFDVYSFGNNTYLPGDITSGGITGQTLSPQMDLFLKVALLPPALSPSPSGYYFGVLRIRAHSQIIRADVHVSVGGSYTAVGTQNTPCAGGKLNRPFFATEGTPDLAVGPTITAANTDIQNVLDLSANGTDYNLGRQLMVIDNEIMFLERVTAVSGGWQLEGIRRGQYGTVVADHAVNTPVFIFEKADITPLTSNIFAAGQSVNVKVQPGTLSSLLSIGSVTPVTFFIPV